MMNNRQIQVKIMSFREGKKAVKKTTYIVENSHDIEFTVSANTSEAPNTADIAIFNLEAPDIFSGDYSKLELYVGNKEGLSLLYRGDIVACRAGREGIDMALYITCGTGTKTANINTAKTYTENIDFSKIADDMLGAFKNAGGEVVAGMQQKLLDTVKGKKTPSSFGAKGAFKTLNELLNNTGKALINNNDTLHLVDGATKQIDGTVIVLDKDTGLTGYIQKGFSLDEKGKKTTTINCECLINTAIIPGRKIRLPIGDFIVQNLEINGGNRSGNWNMTIEAR